MNRFLCTVAMGAALGLGVQARGGEDYSFTNWPADPEWVALTNHLGACYRAVLVRCEAAGVGADGCAPTYIWPMLDYTRLAEKVDQLAPLFVRQDRADGDGSFHTWFATADAQGKLPDCFPAWTAAGLREAAGFAEWATNGVLHSWMACDHAIQAQVTAALGRLLWTTNTAAPDAVGGGVAGTAWTWTGYGWTETEAAREKLSDAAGWPYAVLDTCPKPANLEEVNGVTNTHSGSHDFSWSGSWGAATSARPGWPHRVRVNWSGVFEGAWGETARLQINGVLLHAAQNVPSPDNWSGTATMITADTSYQMEFLSTTWGTVTVREWATGATSLGSRIEARRRSGRIRTTAALATNVAASAELYLVGDRSFPGPGELWNYYPHERLTNFAWAPEVALATAAYQRVASLTYNGGSNGVFYSGMCLTNVPYPGADIEAGTIVQQGWAVKNGHWVMKWQFPALPDAGSFGSREDCDTDRDDLVEVGADIESFGPDTGTAVLQADQERPCVYVPLASTPKWYEGLAIHAYLSQGAFEGLPYRYLSVPRPLADAAMAAGQGQAFVAAGLDDDGALQAYSLNTRILESGCVISGDRRVKQVAVLRPRGNVVIFDFPWDAQAGAFSGLGFPIGVNSRRTYVLRDATPETHTDRQYELHFASGVIHGYGIGHGNPYGPTRSDPYDSGWLMTVRHVNGAGVWIASEGPLDWLEGTRFFPGCGAAWSHAQNDWAACGVENEFAQDGRYDVTWVREAGGRIKSVRYTSRKDSSKSIVSTLAYGPDGNIAGISKTGPEGAGVEATGVTLTPGGDVERVTYGWGTVSRSQTAPSGQARTVAFTTAVNGVDGTVEQEARFDALDRRVSFKLTANDDSAETVYIYQETAGRYANGLLKNTRLARVKYPGGATVNFEYAEDTGWLAKETAPIGNGVNRVVLYGYETHGAGDSGDAADPGRLVERPRTVEVKWNDTVIGRTLYSFYKGSGHGDPACVRVQRCPEASAGWDSPGNLSETHTYDVFDPGEYPYWLTSGAYPVEDGRLLSSVYPGGSRSCGYSVSENSLTATVASSDGRQTVTRVNAFGFTEYAKATEDGVTTEEANSGADAFGRILRTDYLDRTWTLNSDYGLQGPQTVREIDGSQATYVYTPAGQVKTVSEPALGRITAYEFDAAGNRVKTTVTGGDKSFLTEASFDAQGRLRMSKDPLGTTTVTYQPMEFGTRKTTTAPAPGGTAMTEEDFFFDGSPKQIGGTGAGARKRWEYGVEDGMLFEKEIGLDAGGNDTEEWVKSYRNLLGQVCKVQRNGVAAAAELASDDKGRPFKTVDEEGLVDLTHYNAKNEVEHSGQHVDGTGDRLTSASNDRFSTYARSVSGGGHRVQTSVYPVPNNGTAMPISSSETSLDGRRTTSTVGDKTSESGRSAYGLSGDKGGCYAVTNRMADGKKTVSTYEQWRLKEVRTYEDGVQREVEEYGYDGLGALEEIRNSRTGVTRIHRDECRRVKFIDRPGTADDVTFTYWDGTTLKKSEGHSDGKLTRWEYYPDGRLKRQYDGGTHDIRCEYDLQGRTAKLVTQRDGKFVTTEWVRDSRTGFLEKKQVWPAGAATPTVLEWYTCRGNGDVLTVNRPGSTLTETYLYDLKSGDLTGLTYNDGTAAITFGLNRLGQRVSAASSNGIAEVYGLDIEGKRLSDRITGNGVVSNALMGYGYAAMHDGVTGLQYEVTGVVSGNFAVVYDAGSRVYRITDGGVTVRYGYPTNADFVESVIVSNATGIVMEKKIGRDPETERVTNIVYRVNGSPIAAYAYGYPTNSAKLGRVTRLDGSYWTYSYDGKDQLATAGVFTAEGVPVPGMQFVYEYDEIGNTIKAGALGTNGQSRHTFQANDLNQHVARNWGMLAEVMGSALTNAVVTVNDVRVARQGEYFHADVPVANGAGSVDTLMTVRAVWFDGTNDVVAQGGGKLYVPKAEEAVEHRPSGAIRRDSRFEYAFNFRDQLTSVTSLNASPNFKLTFDYYPDGRRAAKRVYEWSAADSRWVEVRVHHFYYDDWNLIAESMVSGLPPQADPPEADRSEVYSYTWGLDLSGQETGRWGQEAGGIGGLLAITKVSGGVTNVYFPVCDRQGNIHKVMDAFTGATVAEYEYSPFGVLVSATSGFRSPPSSFSFMSKYYDPETELYYFGYRYYDPVSTKWLTRDPEGEAGGINEFTFCLNDPVNHVDGRGLENVVVSGTDGTQFFSKDVSDEKSVTSYFDYAGVYYFGVGNFKSVGSFMTAGGTFLRKTWTMPFSLVSDVVRPVIQNPLQPINAVSGFVGGEVTAVKNLTKPNFYTYDVESNGGKVKDIIVRSQDVKDVVMGHSQGVTLIAYGLAQASKSDKVRKDKTIKLVLMAPKIQFELLEKYIADAKKNQPGWKIDVLVIGNRYDTTIPSGTERGYAAPKDSDYETVRVQGGSALFVYRQQKRPGIHYGRGFPLGRQSAYWTTYEFLEPKDPHSSFLHTGLVSDPAAGVSELADAQSQVIRNKIQTFINQ